ncbi:PstS family phosphate ABC transporter substrate-binding protein [Halobacterium wangiae]|uniref:PstS family phosphate ABC transporter substrate-binding protein n=1 Tax=Halobacterium wangiae TaxID=2902623 RepID=UPI001E61C70B|nr:PstS family phosphate ABC transporter substrate-binding protein [Halobacterium wangiae]
MTGNDPERTVRTRRQVLAGLGAVGAATIAGCQSTEGGGSGDGLSGTIDIAGSSTVFPLATAMSEEFRADHGEVGFNLQSTGSGGGFANHFCPGNTDFNNASRAIREPEQEQCASNDVEPVELTVATDALTVIVNNDLDIDSITVEDLATIWSAEEQPETWADVNSEWPDEPLELYGPSDASGTYDYFIEAILHSGDSEVGHRQDYSATEQDRTIIQGVEGSQSAMGYLGFAYYSTNTDRVKALAIDDGDGEPVEPSLETARSGEYQPLSRPLFTYASKSSLSEEHVAEFARFWLENSTSEQIVAEDVGYVPLSEEDQQAQMDTLETAIEDAGN